jgi:hypothetical protein
MATINDVWTAYDEAKLQWTGCDWPTQYGSAGLDLNGMLSGEAHQAADHWRAIAADEVAYGDVTTEEEDGLVQMARHLRLSRAVALVGRDQEYHSEVCGNTARLFCADNLAREWEFASHWLEEIESDALWAEEEAQRAVAGAEDGDWDCALEHACRACSIESGYHHPRPWRHLKQVIKGMCCRAGMQAITALNGHEVDGRALSVNEARPREERSNKFAGKPWLRRL